MDGKIDEMDKISNLPDFILHRILSFLPREDAVRTCVLSKRWGSVWDCFPIFEFCENRNVDAAYWSTPEYKVKVREFMNIVEHGLAEIHSEEVANGEIEFVYGICGL